MPFRPLVPLPIIIADRELTQLAKLSVDTMRQGLRGSLQSLPVVLSAYVGLVAIGCEADNVTRFADVHVVVETTVIIAAASGIQEGATDTDHDELDGEKKCGESWVEIYMQRLAEAWMGLTNHGQTLGLT